MEEEKVVGRLMDKADGNGMDRREERAKGGYRKLVVLKTKCTSKLHVQPCIISDPLKSFCAPGKNKR